MTGGAPVPRGPAWHPRLGFPGCGCDWRRLPSSCMSTLDLFSPSPPLTSAGRVVSIHRSDGGVPKLAIPAARITAAGIEGDRQRNLKHHGGPDRALCLYSLE